VAAGEDADHQLIDHIVLAHHDLRNLRAQTLVGLFQAVECGQIRLKGSGHGLVSSSTLINGQVFVR
jgi:hypothetical protein